MDTCCRRPQDLLHTYDKFVGPLPEEHEEGTRALHSLFPSLFDNKVVMSSAIDAGLAFPQTVLGEGFRWLRETQTPQNDAVAAARNKQKKTVENGAGGTDNEDNGKHEGDKIEVENGDAEKSTDEPPTSGSNSSNSGNRRSRAVWDASFAPGFEERYADGGQEHEAGYDAYLTGCCFAAAATLGLGVAVEELKGMGSGDGAGGGGEVPEALRSVQNVVPLWRMVRGVLGWER